MRKADLFSALWEVTMKKMRIGFFGDFDHSMYRIGFPDSPDISGRIRGLI